MSARILLYTFCLLANLQLLLTAHPKIWSNYRSQTEEPSSYSYESLEIFPLTSKLADRSNTMTDRIDEQDRDKFLTLFTNTKNEVDEKMAWLNKLHGYFNQTYKGILDVYAYYNRLKLGLGFLTHLGFNKRSRLRRHRHRFL